ncbi:hypothetical protein [Flavobacterium sp. W22_SRS_FP1]|uniref:hypothetical protein n=1 Tax=Flavobacterium sp. W22_SRS_FP1 TaxID=3240276 RepID=UPI003F92F828
MIAKPSIENNVSGTIGRIIFHTKSGDTTEGKAKTKAPLIFRFPNQYWLIEPIIAVIPTIKGNK